MIERHRPLPLPPFRSLLQLSSEELRNVCVAHYRTSLNLSLPEPSCRKCSVLALPKEEVSEPIYFFSVLHGGRHGLIFYGNGLVQLWDLHHKREDPFREAGVCDVVNDAHYTPTNVGLLLASYELEVVPADFDYEAKGDGEIVIAAYSQPS